jgi:hypothetical protein
MLKNSAYCGEYVAYRYQVTRETDNERRHIKMRPETDLARVVLPPEVCPPTVSKELFQAAQKQLERNKAESIRNNKAPFLTCCGVVSPSVAIATAQWSRGAARSRMSAADQETAGYTTPAQADTLPFTLPPWIMRSGR